jgi:hypothetical protein
MFLIDFLALVVFLLFKLDLNLFLVYSISINLIYFLVIYLLISYRSLKQNLLLEKDIVNEILRICSFNFVNIKLIINKLSNSDSKLISSEFNYIEIKLKKGFNLNDLLLTLKTKYDCLLFNKFLNLLLISNTSGTTSIDDFKNLMDNYLLVNNILKQRKSLLLMQKYTIVLCSALLLPAIISIVIGMVSSFSQNLDFSSFGFDINPGLFNVVYYCALIYIFENIVISSFYLSLLEDQKSKFIVYILILVPISIFVFFISRNIL